MENRPRPEALLQEYHREEDTGKGHLKIFFGYAAGVGKTYAMLEAAHQAQKAGVDVVAGYIEPHMRPETAQLLDGLEQLQPVLVPYKDIQLREFDLDTALQRHPQLILVDELAHTNASACRHKKRYQDVEELLRAGIDVYTTVNVQHMESLNDLVSSITGVTVRERVPDWVFDSADQVEVVDIEPDDLIQRLKEGKIYKKKQADKALTAFFSHKNLAALREIALRRTADRLNRTAQKIQGHSNAGAQLLICLSPSPSNARVIRTAARMSEALDGRFIALFVETSDYADMSEDNRKRLQKNLKLAEDLGAQIVTIYGDDVATQIAEYARASGITQIVLGRTNHRVSFLHPGRNLIDRLTALAPNLDIYIIPDQQPEYRKKWTLWSGHKNRQTGSFLENVGRGILLILLATAAGLLFDAAGFRESDIVIVYLLAVLLAGIWTRDRRCGALMSVLGVLTYNFFFTVPRYTLQVYNATYLTTFLIMFASSYLTTSLVIHIQQISQQTAQKAYHTELLLETSQQLQKADNSEAIIRVTATQIQKMLSRPVVFYLKQEGEELQKTVTFPWQTQEFPQDGLTEAERGVAEWVCKNNKHAGATTGTLPSAHCLYLAVRGQNQVFAVAGIYMEEGRRILEAFEKNLLIAVLSACGLALEKQKLQEEKEEVELKARQEQLRANLLRAISHDLRTPLTSISGNAGILMQQENALSPAKRQELYLDIYDDSMWLVNLVENLLSVTRIENGTMNLTLQPELLEDVFHEAVQHLDRHAAEHSIETEIPEELLMAQMDARLIVQVLINLINNAITYTPAGSHIRLRAVRKGAMVAVSVADDGPGIPEASRNRLFEMFYTGDQARTDSRRGLGLGLALCRSIVEAHGGKIRVKECEPQGTEFVFTLRAAEVKIYE